MARPAELLDAEQLRQRYEAGASRRELAQDNKTDDGVIRDTLRGAGVHIRRRVPITRWQNILTAELLQQKYVQEQLGLAQIAQQLAAHTRRSSAQPTDMASRSVTAGDTRPPCRRSEGDAAPGDGEAARRGSARKSGR